MKVKIVYSENEAAKPLIEGRAQNYLVVCDAATGEIYRATEFRVNVSKPSVGTPLFLTAADTLFKPEDDAVIGTIESTKAVFFEDFKGPTMDMMEQMAKSNLSPAERQRVLFAKCAYDQGAKKAFTGPKNAPAPKPN